MAQRIDGWVVHPDDGDVALLLRLDYGHSNSPYFPRRAGARALASAGLRARLLCCNEACQGGTPMLRGLMMDRPLLVSA